MTSQSISVVICVVISISLGYSAGNLTCGPNEVIDDCPANCSYEYCPTNEFHDYLFCLKPDICPPPACTCAFNYRRAENGTCISTYDCPPFECLAPNEVFDICPSYCPEDCQHANPIGECPFLSLLVVECTPSCRCKPNYWRKKAYGLYSLGKCVHYLECPGVLEALIKNKENKTLLKIAQTST
ncbi:uncharacterized protein [Epargyreus clarus]|uniref:uncharacterized protein n=1 Tax=Epargyreus clarus TaxID=520877 RepID=UPI003C2B3FA6